MAVRVSKSYKDMKMLFAAIVLECLLLAIISSAYAYGYHPSAEEFESLMRESPHTWTRDILASQHRRSWSPANTAKRNELGNFVPKWSLEKERARYSGIGWQEHMQKLDNRYDQPQLAVASNVYPVAVPLDSDRLQSNLDFKLFSNEDAQVDSSENGVFSGSIQTVASTPATTAHPLLRPTRQSAVTIIEIDDKPSEPHGPWTHKKHNSSSSSDENLPIYFTNPATGIVYAITEVGRVQGNATRTSSNGSIPIYVTKEQYDRDLLQLKQRYEKSCRPSAIASTDPIAPNKDNRPSGGSSFSSSVSVNNSTVRPQIIHLQNKPAVGRPSVSKLPTFQLPISLSKPVGRPPRIEQVKKVSADTTTSKKQTKRKRKKQHKQPANRPAAVPAQPTPSALGPVVVRGTRTQPAAGGLKPSASTDHLHTQMERPNLSMSTVFSNSPLVAKRGYMSSTSKNKSATNKTVKATNHRMRREAANIVNLKKDKNVNESLVISPSNAANISLGLVAISAPKSERSSAFKLIKDKRVEPYLVNIAGNTSSNFRHSPRSPSPRRRQQRIPTANAGGKVKLPKTPESGKGDTMGNRWRHAVLLATGHGNGSSTDSLPKDLKETDAVLGKTKGRGQGSSKRKNDDDDDDFDLLDFLDDLVGDSKEKKNEKDVDDDDDDYYDDDDDDDDAKDEGADVEVVQQKKKKIREGETKPEIAQEIKETLQQEPTAQPAKDMKKKSESSRPSDEDSESSGSGSNNESTSDHGQEEFQSNSSSAEDNADFGALEEVDATTEDMDIIWNSKNTPATTTDTVKKRIRRRPASDVIDDYDDDDDDYESDNSVSGFFRMLLYPVQMAMSKFFALDRDDSSSGEDDEPSKYPTYTLYHSPSNTLAEDSSNESQSSSSLTDWLGSWFGYNRRTKNIGSTTKAPPTVSPQMPPPTQRPSSWLETIFGFGGSSTESTESTDYDKWFFGWFDAKPKARRRTTTSTTSTTTPAAIFPQVPILTIVDPLKNPQNWIGILAHHLVNSTSTSTTTQHPLLEAITRATTTSTTTENPDIPRLISYDKFQIWRLKPQDDGQVKALEDYKRSEDGAKLQWLKGPSLRGLTDVLVPPKMLIDFRSTLNFELIAYQVLIFDVGKAITYEKTKEAFQLSNKTKTNNMPMAWHKYHEYDDIVKYLEAIRVRHPQLVELVHIGRSYEGRPLVVVKLEQQQRGAAATAAAQMSQKKLKYKKKSGHANAVFIEAGTHGLEWIGPAAATWMINELLRLMRTNKTGEEFEYIRKTTWYIMPVLNPDGYAYSHEYDRFWKKSRSRHISRSNGIIDKAMSWIQQKRQRERICYGVDLDRNWAYEWGKRGSSKSPCNEFYAGPIPFSEPETKALSEFLMDQRKHIKLFMSLQAYGQIVSFPIRANVSFNSERMNDFLDVAMVGTDGLRKKGSKARYKIDTTNDLMEHRTGCSDAFAAYEVGVPFSFTTQLADNGVHGYLLPSSSIEPTARDAFEIITAMLDYI